MARYTASRRTALKVLGGTVASGGAALTSLGGGVSAAASEGRTGRIPEELKPGGTLDRLAADLASKDEFSGSLRLTYRRKPVLARSYGMADKKTGVRNGMETRFGLGSISKMFTAVSVHSLVQQGKVNYTDKLGAHLDGFPAHIADKVTIHHMFTHSSGLGDFHNLPGYREASKTWDSADEVLNGTVEFIRKMDLAFEPGAGSTYSNAAYCLLGAIVAAVSGRSYYDYVKEHVFDAAHMRDSDFLTKPEWRADPQAAHCYYKRRGESEWTDSLEEHPYIQLPAGGSFATCADMERFAHHLLEDDLLDAPYTSMMLNPKIPNPNAGSETTFRTMKFAGYGSLTRLSNDQWIYGHGGGSTLGTSAHFDVYPGSGWVVVVLSNYPDKAADPIADLARDVILQQ
ncbi:class A beta-lactamase-related serine hydrolase [Actinomadura darangshiensis]|uniref:Class A beta-lactamase-related serine hydrolase n=1 Tax=Actinomadura darangshiensis TaxID=705336 RepID=A0A4R5B4M5_9ACTN|nr:serine hydrolase domain-containing protein [Actinomadura darangshiensis]TDD79500.1 class A beta-lactamase-related serine hydrolase [Actinomadura darangshiensis]